MILLLNLAITDSFENAVIRPDAFLLILPFSAGIALAGVLYVALPTTLMLAVPQLLSQSHEWNPWYAICYILIIWANDSLRPSGRKSGS